MSYDVMIDVGNTRIKVGLFEEGTLRETLSFASHSPFRDELVAFLEKKSIKHALISSVTTSIENNLKKILDEEHITYAMLDFKQVALKIDVDEPEELGHDRIANAYGALHHFPTSDCIVIDIGTAVTFDYVTKEGRYIGGAIYPGNEICAKGLAQYTDKLPYVDIVRPASPLAKTSVTHIQSGIYYGLLGAIERIVFELKQTSDSPSFVQVLATGGATAVDNLSTRAGKIDFLSDLKDLVDFIDPHLTLVGINEIHKELTLKKKEN